MDNVSKRVVGEIFQNHRHLMTEPERRADRAFAFQAEAESTGDPGRSAGMRSAMEEALADAAAEELFRKGRQRFMEDVARRVIAEHRAELPSCGACGSALRQPNPRDCFDCDYH